MRTLILIIFVLSTGLIYSQSQPDSTQNKEKKQEQIQNQEQKSELNQVQNQTGPKENSQSNGQFGKKKKDVFVDKDGDGICDSRQSGMSFTKMRKRMGAGKSGSQNGNSGGSGNSNTNQSGNNNSGGSK